MWDRSEKKQWGGWQCMVYCKMGGGEDIAVRLSSGCDWGWTEEDDRGGWPGAGIPSERKV